MDKKIFCGSGKKQSDTWIKATINPDVIVQHIDEHKGKKFVKIDINIEKKKDKYGKDVKITIDTWKPDTNYKPKEETIVEPEEDIKIDDIPF